MVGDKRRNMKEKLGSNVWGAARVRASKVGAPEVPGGSMQENQFKVGVPFLSSPAPSSFQQSGMTEALVKHG